jgi:hypothetical protein
MVVSYFLGRDGNDPPRDFNARRRVLEGTTPES